MKTVITAAAALMIASAVAQAASQDECAIWLCLPQGFPGSECSGPESAMWDRIEDDESPLPEFSECAVEAEGMSYQEGYAAYIPPHQHCVKSHREQRGYNYGGGPKYVTVCDESVDVPGKYLEGVACRHVGFGGTQPSCPAGNHEGINYQHYQCTGTKRFVRILQNGKQLGSVYYY